MLPGSSKKPPSSHPISFRSPKANDGRALWSLVHKLGSLDNNSHYLYMLLGEHFSQTSILAEHDNKLAGFVSAYVKPEHTDTLFIWQIAVDPSYQKKGIALAMLKTLLNNLHSVSLTCIQATVTPSNTASRALFSSLAQSLHATIQEQLLFPKTYFTEAHEDEILVSIGPFQQPLSK